MLSDRFDQEVWDVLQHLREESLIAGKNGVFEFTLQIFKLKAPGIPDVSRARKIIKNYLAEQEGAIKIIEEVEADWGASISGLFMLRLIQPAFDKLYERFRMLNSTQKEQVSKVRPPEERDFYYENGILHFRLATGEWDGIDFSKALVMKKVFETFWYYWQESGAGQLEPQKLIKKYKELFKESIDRHRIAVIVSNIRASMLNPKKNLLSRVVWKYDKASGNWIFRIS
jgi:hypothetical protein